MTLEMQRRMKSVRAVSLLLGTALLGVVSAGCAKRAPEPAPVPAPGPTAALLPPATPEPGPAYRIQLGDELHVRFIYQPDQNEQTPVRPDGRITLATTGEIAVVGLTPTELEQLIVEKSSKRLRDPEVTVIVTKLGEQRVYVGGEVARPGFVVLRPDMTLLQAVLQSGGFRKTAKLNSVLLMTPDADGQFSAARIDMQQVVESGVPERVRLHPNDVLYVPPTWISDMNDVVDLYVRGLFPALPRVGAGYSLN
jgi:protein involved in polysaccharide export with SLBB domain